MKEIRIRESTDHFLQTVYIVEEGDHRVAELYTLHDAEVVKAAIEKDREEQARQTNWW